MLRRVIWRALAKSAALFFAVIPRRRRFRVALRISVVVAVIAGAWLQRRGMRGAWATGPYDEALRFVMRVLADGAVMFDPELVIDSTVALEPRAIYVTAHFPITAFFLRHAHDRGIHPVVVKAFPEIDAFVWGTREKFHAVHQTPAVLVKLRQHIREGHPPVVLIDTPKGTTVPFESDYGNSPIATHIFELAKRLAIPTFFLAVRLGRVPVIVIRPMAPDPAEFIALLKEQAALIRR
jgi:hypothetical protein